MFEEKKTRQRRSIALRMFVINRTCFLFQKSTYTPAITPINTAGSVKERTASATAVFDLVNEKTTKMRKKLKTFTAICVKISLSQR